MNVPFHSKWRLSTIGAALAVVCLAGALSSPCVEGKAPKRALRVGSTSSIAPGENKELEKNAKASLKRLIKQETGFATELSQQRDWREFVEALASGKVQVGVLQGYEFAWAKQKHPELQALALAISGQRYPVAVVVTQQSNRAENLAGLSGQSLSIPPLNGPVPRLFIERQVAGVGKTLDKFFAKVTFSQIAEDALDDVVDGKVQGAAVTETQLEAYRREKPGRFKQLKEVARSIRTLPTIIATYDSLLDEATVNRFRKGLMNAHRKEKGRSLLAMFRVKRFEDVPEDFDQVMAETLKAWPADQ